MTTPHHQDAASATVDVVIVNWNAGIWLKHCLDSLAHFGGPDVARVTVVDNGSTDGSHQVAVDGLPLQIVEANANLGFGRACNLGARGGSAPYILFLNPDAAMIDGSLGAIVDFMQSAEGAGVGICGPRLVGEDGRTQRSCSNFARPSTYIGGAMGLSERLPWLFKPQLAQINYDLSQIVDQPIGAYFVIRRSLFEELGGFDERFFVYFEEVDLAFRAKKRGWDAYYLADAVAFHKGGGTSERVKAERLFYSLRSRLLFVGKHYSRASLIIVLLTSLGLEPVGRLTRAALRRSGDEAKNTLRAYRLLLGDAAAIARTIVGRRHRAK